jgi:hypothetical protein
MQRIAAGSRPHERGHTDRAGLPGSPRTAVERLSVARWMPSNATALSCGASGEARSSPSGGAATGRRARRHEPDGDHAGAAAARAARGRTRGTRGDASVTASSSSSSDAATVSSPTSTWAPMRRARASGRVVSAPVSLGELDEAGGVQGLLVPQVPAVMRASHDRLSSSAGRSESRKAASDRGGRRRRTRTARRSVWDRPELPDRRASGVGPGGTRRRDHGCRRGVPRRPAHRRGRGLRDRADRPARRDDRRRR